MGKSNKENAQIWSEKGANEANQVHTFKVPILFFDIINYAWLL